jgi:hypothetical protein
VEKTTRTSLKSATRPPSSPFAVVSFTRRTRLQRPLEMSRNHVWLSSKICSYSVRVSPVSVNGGGGDVRDGARLAVVIENPMRIRATVMHAGSKSEREHNEE